MSLEFPTWLFLLALLPFYWRLRWQRMSQAPIVFAPLQYRDAGRGRVRLSSAQLIVEGVLLALILLALAGPHRLDEVTTIGEEGLDLALCLDISASMQADDFPPNRLESLKSLAAQLVERSPNNRIAVYAFAGHVFTQTPLTADHQTLANMVSALSFDSIDHAESGGTALGDALLSAVEGLGGQRVEGRDQVVFLITDGESNLGLDPLLAARFLAEEGVRLVVLGVGGVEPVEVSVRGRPFINTEDKALVTSLDDEQLVEIAKVGGGVYYRARSQDALEQIFAYLGRLERTPLEVETVRIRSSLIPQLAAMIGLAFVGWMFIEGWYVRRPLR